MRKCAAVGFALVLFGTIAPLLSAQQTPSSAEAPRPMVLTEAIPLEGVKGRFDHFATSGPSSVA